MAPEDHSRDGLPCVQPIVLTLGAECLYMYVYMYIYITVINHHYPSLTIINHY